jgi:hypothetical protein
LLCLPYYLAFLSHAQRFDWVSSAGYVGPAGGYNEFCCAITRDSQEFVYTRCCKRTWQCQDYCSHHQLVELFLFLYKFNAQGEIIYIKTNWNDFTALNVVVGDDINVYVLGSMGTSEIRINNKQ